MLEKFDGAAEDLSLYSLYEVTDSGRRKSTETEWGGGCLSRYVTEKLGSDFVNFHAIFTK